MGYTQTTVREYETGEWTLRKVDTGEYVVIVCFPYETMNDYSDIRQGWTKAHAVHASWGPGTKGKTFAAPGLCWQYAKRHYPNCTPQPHLHRPLAVSDYWNGRLDDIPVMG